MLHEHLYIIALNITYYPTLISCFSSSPSNSLSDNLNKSLATEELIMMLLNLLSVLEVLTLLLFLPQGKLMVISS